MYRVFFKREDEKELSQVYKTYVQGKKIQAEAAYADKGTPMAFYYKS